MKNSRLRLMLIDDSVANLKRLRAIFLPLGDIEIVGTAHDCAGAETQLLTLRPDCITIDLDMPPMECLPFMKAAMEQLPRPVIVLGSEAQRGPLLQVFESGAFDVLLKPTRFVPEGDEGFTQRLISLVRATRESSSATLIKRFAASDRTFRQDHAPIKVDAHEAAERLVVLGASTGGPPAIQSILKQIGGDTRVAVIVVQHMPERFTRTFAERLNRLCGLVVLEAEDDAEVLSGHAYIAPGGMQLEVGGGVGRARLVVRDTLASDRYTPSIDRLLLSAAPVFRRHLLAVILTGMGNDGARGIRAVFQAGGQTVAESQQSAVVWGMPGEAIATGCVRRTLELDEIVTCVGQFSFRAYGV